MTRRERDLLVFIHGYMFENVVAPSYSEMAAGIGVRSKAAIHRLTHGLAMDGYIRQMPGRARALEIVRMPADLQTTPAARRPHRSLVMVPMRGYID